ncbi:MAG: 3-oxoacyl-ACP reductase FabG [Bacteriovoracaceae bacterium]|nr:3-oxoacyl-ACP reductase FabG [Bacteriovoracaceae bacterium]
MIVNYPDLKDKNILVTGASRGIGKAIARSLATQGAHVVFNFRPEREGADQLKAELEELGGKATCVYFDLTNNEDIKSSLDGFVKEFGPISGLVNNAGISKDQLALRLKKEDIEHTLDVNLLGPMLVTAALSRNFLKASDVSIVNISSIVGLMGNASQASYSASKAGILGFTKSIAKELASRNIRCNAICPGFIETDMTAALHEKAKETYLAEIPLKRMGSAEEIANLTNFLLSGASSYITGEIIKIDGGLYI